jgi:hypothetical protein
MKKSEDRSTLEELLNTEFITKYQNEQIDADYVKSIVESIQLSSPTE